MPALSSQTAWSYAVRASHSPQKNSLNYCYGIFFRCWAAALQKYGFMTLSDNTYWWIFVDVFMQNGVLLCLPPARLHSLDTYFSETQAVDIASIFLLLHVWIFPYTHQDSKHFLVLGWFFLKCLNQAQVKAEVSACTGNKICDPHSAHGVVLISMSWYKDCAAGSNQRLIWQCLGLDNKCPGIGKKLGENIVILYPKHFPRNEGFVLPKPSANPLAFRSPQWISFPWCCLAKYWAVVLKAHKQSAPSVLWHRRA